MLRALHVLYNLHAIPGRYMDTVSEVHFTDVNAVIPEANVITT